LLRTVTVSVCCPLTALASRVRELPTNMEQHEIIRIPSLGQIGREHLLQQCYDVRIDVFHREQGFPLDTEIDEFCLFYSIILAVKGLFPLLPLAS